MLVLGLGHGMTLNSPSCASSTSIERLGVVEFESCRTWVKTWPSLDPLGALASVQGGSL